jgi:hypothetical protein
VAWWVCLSIRSHTRSNAVEKEAETEEAEIEEAEGEEAEGEEAEIQEAEIEEAEGKEAERKGGKEGAELACGGTIQVRNSYGSLLSLNDYDAIRKIRSVEDNPPART